MVEDLVSILELDAQKLATEPERLIDRLFSLDGRLNRARYFWRTVGIALLTQILAVSTGLFIGANTSRWEAETTATLAGLILGLLGAAAQAFPAVKRLHDLNRPGWHYWLALVPLYNIYLGLVLLFQKGDYRPHQYGPDPLGGQAPLKTTTQSLTKDPNEISCDRCGFVQFKSRTVCQRCGAKFAAGALSDSTA